MLRREVPEAREILRNLIVGRIVFTPRPETRLYEFSGRGSLGRLLAGAGWWRSSAPTRIAAWHRQVELPTPILHVEPQLAELRALGI